MDHTQTHYDLVDAFAEDGCPFCRLGLATVHRWMDAVDYESVGDPEVRQRLRAAQGFCHEHAHQWLGQAHVLGTAQIYRDVLSELTDALRVLPAPRQTFLAGVASLLAPGPSQRGGAACAVLAPVGRCPACRVLDDTEAMLAETLVAGLAEAGFAAAYAASAGLCLPHLRLAVCRANDEAAFVALRDAAIAKQERLLAQLDEVIRRHDYRFVGEPWGEERGAATRAVQHVVGARGLTDR